MSDIDNSANWSFETRQLQFETRRIHAGYDSNDHFHSVNVPIYQSAAFDLSDIDRARRLWTGAEAGGIYTRVGNPTVGVLEARVAELDGGSAAIGLASGMAAIAYTLMLLTESGGNIVFASSLYGAAQEALTHFLPKFGVETRPVNDRSNPASYAELIDDNTRAIYLESISNPNIEIYDFEAIATIAHSYGVPLIIDNTVATPYLFQPFQHGADLIVYSATKGLTGHGNVIAGLVVEKGGFAYDPKRFPQFHTPNYKIRDINGKLRTPLEAAPDFPVVLSLRAFYLEFLGASLSPFNAYLAIQGLDTLVERLDKQVATTKQLVAFLESRDEVEWVRYPSARDNAYKALAEKYFPRGAGAVFSFGLKGERANRARFIEALRLISYHVNLGDVRTLIANPPETTHAELTYDLQAAADIPSNLLRISVGLESAVDLIADLEQALEAAFR